MALTVLQKGWVLVGSTPINDSDTGIASPGCLILLDFWGSIRGVASDAISTADPMCLMRTPTINGPWGAAVKDQGSTVSVWVSMVLGANPSSTDIQEGAAGGTVVRLDMTVPQATQCKPALQFSTSIICSSGSSQLPTINAVTTVASGFPTNASGIAGGTVGPAGLVHDPVGGGANLYIADTLSSTVWYVNPSASCKGVGAPSNPCVPKVLTANSFLNLPVGLSLLPNGNVLASNGGIGSLVELAPAPPVTPGAGLQISARLVDDTVDAPGGVVGGGNLFNAVAGKDASGKARIYFVNDNLNNIQVLGY